MFRLLRFHLQAESVGLFSEGMLAFEGDGTICAVNQSALNLLGRVRSDLLGQPVDSVFDCARDELFARASEQASTSWPLRTREGRYLFAALRGQPRRLAAPVMAQPEPERQLPKPPRQRYLQQRHRDPIAHADPTGGQLHL